MDWKKLIQRSYGFTHGGLVGALLAPKVFSKGKKILFGTKPSIESLSTLSPQQEAFFNFLAEKARTGKVTPYEGQLELTPPDRLPQAWEDYFRTNVEDRARRQYEEEILPSIRRSYGGTFWGSERAKAEERASENYLRNLIAQRSAFTLESVPLLKEIERYNIEAKQREFLRQQEENNPFLQMARDLLNVQTKQYIAKEGTKGIAPDLIRLIPSILSKILGGV